jgi:hypothetical protein
MKNEDTDKYAFAKADKEIKAICCHFNPDYAIELRYEA